MSSILIPTSYNLLGFLFVVIAVLIAVAVTSYFIVKSPYTAASEKHLKEAANKLQEDYVADFKSIHDTSKKRSLKYQVPIAERVKVLDDKLANDRQNLPELVKISGFKYWFLPLVAMFSTVVLIFLAFYADASVQKSNADSKAEWVTAHQDWAYETYGVVSDLNVFFNEEIPPVAFDPLAYCHFGNLNQRECVIGEVLTERSDSSRFVSKAAFVLIGETTIMVNFNGEQLERITDKQIPVANAVGADIRSQLFPELRERYDIRDIEIPADKYKCVTSDECYRVAFITNTSELRYGTVALIGGEAILVMPLENNIEYVPVP